MGGDKEFLQDQTADQCNDDASIFNVEGQNSYDPGGLLSMAQLYGNEFMGCLKNDSEVSGDQGEVDGESSTSPVLKGLEQGVQQGGKDLKVDLPLGKDSPNRLRVIDKSKGKIDIKTGKPRGEPIFRIDGPHKGAEFDHINIGKDVPKGMEWTKGLDHTKIPKIPDWALKGAKGLEKVLLPVALGLDAYDLYSSYEVDKTDGNKNYDETKKATGRVAGGWGGALGGAAIGGALGGPIGAVIGGIGGAIAGTELGEWIGDLF